MWGRVEGKKSKIWGHEVKAYNLDFDYSVQPVAKASLIGPFDVY